MLQELGSFFLSEMPIQSFQTPKSYGVSLDLSYSFTIVQSLPTPSSQETRPVCRAACRAKKKDIGNEAFKAIVQRRQKKGGGEALLRRSEILVISKRIIDEYLLGDYWVEGMCCGVLFICFG